MMGSLNAVAAVCESNATANSFATTETANCCSEKNCLLRHLGLGDGFTPAIAHQRSTVHKGELLFSQGDSFQHFYQVRCGSFKSYITNHNGDWQVTGFHFSGDVVGLDGLDSGHHIYAVEALETSSICRLSFDAVEHGLGTDRGKFYRHLISTLCAAEFRQHQSLMVVSRMHADQRLANFLMSLSSSMHARGNSKMEFNLTMARYDIANYLGLAVETLSRLFRRFQEGQYIQVDRQYVRILDMRGLQLILSGETRFSGLQKIA